MDINKKLEKYLGKLDEVNKEDASVYKEKFNSINSELEKQLSKILNINVNLTLHEGRTNYNIKSQDLKKETGFFGQLCETINLDGYMNYSEIKDLIFFKIDLRWQFKKGGENGQDVIQIQYNFNKDKWEHKLNF